MNDMNELVDHADDIDFFTDGEPIDLQTAWEDEGFPDRETWNSWCAAGWGAAPLTAGCWHGAGYGPVEALKLSRHHFPPPGTLESMTHEDRYPDPTGDLDTGAARERRRRGYVDFDR